MEMDQLASLLRMILAEELKPIRDDIAGLKEDISA